MRACPLPSDLLFVPGALREMFVEGRAVFDRALGSREVHRLARQTLVTHEPVCRWRPCMGLAGESLVPPFMPVGATRMGSSAPC